jgi:hypothetical protein
MESNQASEVSVEPFLHSSFPSRKPRRVIVLSDRTLDLPSGPVSYALRPKRLAS